jgi:hypothetical protein
VRQKYTDIFKNLLRTSRSILIKLGTNYSLAEGFTVCPNKGSGPLQRGNNHKNGVGSFKKKDKIIFLGETREQKSSDLHDSYPT